MRKLALFSALALGTAIIAAPAAADEMSRVDVAISDLDLTTAKDREVLERRLRYATRQACEHTMGRRGVSAFVVERDCMIAANASYRGQVEVALAETRNQRVSLLTQ